MPRNAPEQVFANIYMMLGMMMFGLMVGTIANALTRASAEAATLHRCAGNALCRGNHAATGARGLQLAEMATPHCCAGIASRRCNQRNGRAGNAFGAACKFAIIMLLLAILLHAI